MERKRRQELELISAVAKDTKNAVITGPAAARVLGVSNLGWVEQVHLIMPGRSHQWGKKRQYPDRVYVSAGITDEDWYVNQGFRVTTLVRAMFDTYRYCGRMPALVQIESARNKWNAYTQKTLLEQSASLPRAHGLRGFRELICLSTHQAESPLETLARHQILQAVERGELSEVRTVEVQVNFVVKDLDGAIVYARVDLLVNGYIAIELDGRVKTDGTYGDPVAVTLQERHREKELQNLGIIVLRFGWKAVMTGEFLKVIEAVLRMYPKPKTLPLRAA
ncbi:hypothetical protein V6D40_08925 [Corynebacterium sp. Q4381]|uniref:hypothetical protein n=1 Tax=Corynebacterium sp. Marseille-Q4381 TaxID=3121597 RepID=UPI002FE57551